MRLLLAALCSLLIPMSADAHPSHVTLAEMELDAGNLEVSLQLHSAELQRALTRQGRDVPFQKAVESLVRDGVVLESATGAPIPMEWVGVQEAPFGVWVYFQWRLKDPLATHVLVHRLLMDVEPRVVHTVNLTAGKTRQTMTFRQGAIRKALRLPSAK